MSNFYAVLGDMKKGTKMGPKNGARPQFNLKKWGLAAFYKTGPFLRILFLDFILADFVIQRLACNTQYLSGIAFVPMGVSQNSDNMILLHIFYRAKRRWDYPAAFTDMNG